MSNLSLKLKIVNGLYRFVTSKQDSLPLYHGNDVPDFVEAACDLDIGRDYSGSAGISKRAVKSLIRRLSENSHVNLAGLGIMLDGKIIMEHYEPPFNAGYRHVSFSMCKSVVSMAVGIAVSEGLISPDEKIYDIFPAHSGIFVKKYMRDITIRHLLTMTSGADFDEVSSFFTSDWCREFIGGDVRFEPGTALSYNSLNTYMLVAAIRLRSNMSLVEYLNERLFIPLGIRDITWDKCPLGIEKGGWGMKLSLIDMLKLGQLYLNKGEWTVNGKLKRIISPEWIEESVKCHVDVDGKKFVSGYGYQIWILSDGAYLFNGVFGQNVYINTKRNMVIATTASAYELFPEGRLIEELCRFAACDENFKRDNAVLNVFHKLVNAADSKAFSRLKRSQKNDSDSRRITDYLSAYFGVTYVFDEYASSILPVSTQVIYSNYMTGIESLSLSYNNQRLVLCVRDSGLNYSIDVGYTSKNQYAYQILDINGKKFPVAVSGRVLIDEDGRRLFKINIVYLEEVGSKVIKLYFEDGGLKLRANETPDMMIAANKILGEKLIRRTKNLDKDSIPDYVKYKLQQILSPEVRAHIDE